MAQGRFSVVAEVLPPLEKRVQIFAKNMIERSIQKMPLDPLSKAHELGLVKKITCTDENIEVWEHLPVELGDEIYQLVEGLD